MVNYTPNRQKMSSDLHDKKPNVRAIRYNDSKLFHNKENRAEKRPNRHTGEINNKWAFGFSFYPTEKSPQRLIDDVLSGKAFTMACFKYNRRKKEFFESAQILGLDIDNKEPLLDEDGNSVKDEQGEPIEVQRVHGYVSFDDAARHPFIQANAAFMYHTPSSTPTWNRFRIIFILSEPVLNYQRWEILQRGLISEFADWQPDPSCKDAARLWFGSDKPGALIFHNILSIEQAAAFTIAAATDDLLDELARRDAPPRRAIDPSSDTARRVMLKTMNTTFQKMATEGGSRWGNCYKYSAFLFGLMKGDAPVSYAEIEAGAIDASQSSGALKKYGENEIKRCIRDAYTAATPLDFELPSLPTIRGRDFVPDNPTIDYAHGQRRYFADSPPVTWVSLIVTYMRPGAALLFVASQQAARTGAIDPERFYPLDLWRWMQENGYPVKLPTFYRYLESVVDELFSKRKAIDIADTLNTIALQNENNSPGRPADAYYMIELPQLQRRISRQVWARLYDREFATDGKRGTKARPRIAYLTRLGIQNPAAVAAGLDKAYQPIYQHQGWKHIAAEKRITKAHTALVSQLADPTPIPETDLPIKCDKDLNPLIYAVRLKEGEPTSHKEMSQWVGIDHTRIGQDLRRCGYEAQPSAPQIVRIKPGQDIKQAAYEANPNGWRRGLIIDDSPEIQPFEQAIANGATRSVAMVIQPPNAYKYVGIVESVEKPAPTPQVKKIDIQQSKAAPEYKPAPYWGDDISPEVDHNQLVLGLTFTGWIYEKDTGFWIAPANEQYCRTMTEAVQLQAGMPIEPAPTVDSLKKQAEKREIIDPPGVESLSPVETPENDEYLFPFNPEWAGLEF